jgi:hypothetical protein
MCNIRGVASIWSPAATEEQLHCKFNHSAATKVWSLKNFSFYIPHDNKIRKNLQPISSTVINVNIRTHGKNLHRNTIYNTKPQGKVSDSNNDYNTTRSKTDKERKWKLQIYPHAWHVDRQVRQYILYAPF